MKKLTEKQIIKKLQNDNNYYGDFGRAWLSNTDISDLLKDPGQFRIKKPDNENFCKGRYFHQLLLEEKKAKDFPIVDVATRSGEYKKFLEENNLEFALKKTEADEIKNMAEWCMDEKNIKAQPLRDVLKDFNCQTEVPKVGKFYNKYDFKCKADIVCSDIIIDLKTSGDVFSFKRNAPYYNYDTQAFIYLALFKLPAFKFIAVGKNKKYYAHSGEPYYDIGYFDVSKEFVNQGKEKLEQALTIYEKYYSDNRTHKIEEMIIHDKL